MQFRPRQSRFQVLNKHFKEGKLRAMSFRSTALLDDFEAEFFDDGIG